MERPSPTAAHDRGAHAVESDIAAARRAIRLTRRELLDVPSARSHARRAGTPAGDPSSAGSAFYGREALTLAVVARKLTTYGIDARHLRAIKMAAEREVGLVEQAVAASSAAGSL